MNALLYLFRFLYRIRYWLILVPLCVTSFVIWKTHRMTHMYQVSTTIYTGVVSGYDIESGDGERQDWNVINNAMDNLINIITSQTTLRNVSMRLFAEDMMYGDPNKDNNYITANNYRILLSRTPKAVQNLIDKTSLERTLANLNAYEKASRDNYLYGLFHWKHRHYSYEALKKIIVKRLGNSDMLSATYESDDPGIAYNTLLLLNDEFLKQYRELRFGETNNVIAYFEQELARTRGQLTGAEDSLRDFNVDKRVINYDEQTKHIAALSRDYELRYESILLDYNSAKKMEQSLEARIDDHVKELKNNSLFIEKLSAISDLTARITMLQSFQPDTLRTPSPDQPAAAANPDKLQKQLQAAEDELTELTRRVGMQSYTKEGLATTTLVDQWLGVLIQAQKAAAELQVMEDRRKQLDNQYLFFSPIGTTIKRKEREINFTEQSYLSILHSLNAARLKQKSLQMSSATLKVITPPTFPISSVPSKRKMMVAGAFIGSILFILGYFVLLELLDRTLRDTARTRRLTGGTILGAFPRPFPIHYRMFSEKARKIAAQYLGNALLNYFGAQKPNIINLLGVDNNCGKSYVGEWLKNYYEEIGLTVRNVSYHNDFNIQRKNYLLAQELSDFLPMWDDKQNGKEPVDVLLVEHPSLNESTIPKALLQKASVNVLIVRADRVWKDTDQTLFNQVCKQAGNTPVVLYMNMAQREVVEEFTGMLPPYTPRRKWMFKLYQFGLTSSSK